MIKKQAIRVMLEGDKIDFNRIGSTGYIFYNMDLGIFTLKDKYGFSSFDLNNMSDDIEYELYFEPEQIKSYNFSDFDFYIDTLGDIRLCLKGSKSSVVCASSANYTLIEVE